MQVLLLDELTTFLDGEDQRGVLEAVRACVGGPDQARIPAGIVVGVACAVCCCGKALSRSKSFHLGG